MSWQSGEVIGFLNVLDGRVWCVVPVTVLADEPDFLAIRISAGSTWLAAANAQGERIGSWVADWRLLEVAWVGQDCTYLLRPGSHCAIGYCIGHGVTKYYLNAQAPFSRLPHRVVTMDLELDLEIDATGHPACWKDLDRFRRLAAARPVDVAAIVDDCLAAAELVMQPDLRARLAVLSGLSVKPATLGELKDLPGYEPMPQGAAHA